MSEFFDFNRRFSGVRRLYGDASLAKLQNAHVVVVGIGGVGSWAVEALARNAVGTLSIIDLDNIAESNVNRQIHAVEDNFGKAKVFAMQERVFKINPKCVVHAIEEFITPENIVGMLSFDIDIIIDCTDDVKAKIALANFCNIKQLQLLMSGSAGGRIDPTRIQMADLANVTDDKLLAKVRNQLRREHGFPKATNTKKSAKFGIQCIYSNEPVIKPEAACDVEHSSITGLNCAGYGSSVSITAMFGFALAQKALSALVI